jgi:anti-sigma factor RsiW
MEHMDCDDARAYARGDMSAAGRSWCDAHLAGCPRCRELVQQERTLAGLLKLADDPSHLDGVAGRVLARIEPVLRRSARRRSQGWFGWSIGLAALLGMALGLGYRQIRPADSPAGLAPATNVPDPTQRATIANLRLLQTIEANPWVVDNYEAARWLSKLVAGDKGG